MIEQIIFALVLLITLLVFGYTMRRIFYNFKFTKKQPLTKDRKSVV